MWNGTTLLGSAGSAVGTASTTATTSVYTYSFHFGTPIVVPESNTVLVTLKGDIGTYSNKGASDNSQNTFAIASQSDVTALGQTSNKTSNVNLAGTVVSNDQTVLRSTMMVAASNIPQTGGKTPQQQIGTITLTASQAGSVALSNLKLTFSGNGLSAATSTATSSSGNLFLNSIVLKNSNSVDVASANGAPKAYYDGTTLVTPSTTAPSGDVGVNGISWTFSTSTPLVISSGQSVTLQLWGATNVIPGLNGVSESVSAAIQGVGDATYFDGTDSAGLLGTPVNQPINVVPITVTSLSWGQGQ
jgi:hypothetical protein